MLVCIDSNVLLGMFTPKHAHRPIFNAWFEGRLRWAVSTEIMLEYEEICSAIPARPRRMS